MGSILRTVRLASRVWPLVALVGCSSSPSDVATPPGDTGTDTGGADGGTDVADAAEGDAAALSHDDAKALIEAYKAAHPGNGGKDRDINAKSPAELAADPDARRLLGLCGADQRPVIPLLAWEYGGADHPWIKPEVSALVYCVYTPVKPSTDHWKYDATADHVTADVYVRFPEQNPCKSKVGADQVKACIGDPTNFEILVDIASYHDGADVGLSLADASTDLKMLLTDGSRVHLFTGL